MRLRVTVTTLALALCALAGCGGSGGGGPAQIFPIASLSEPAPASTSSPFVAAGVVGSFVTTVTGTPGISCGAGAGSQHEFGLSVSAGDLTGDGRVDLLVGVPTSEFGTPPLSFGKVVVFAGDGSVSCDRSSSFASSNPRHGGNFGRGVLIADVSGDGVADMVVGEPGNGSLSVVYVFRSLGGGTFDAPLTLTSPSSPNASSFGEALQAGDVTGDQVPDLVVGDSISASGAGAVFVYPGDGVGGFASPITLSAPTFTAGLRFGRSVAVGDVTADGKPDIIVGAPGHETPPATIGAVFVFPSNGSGGFGPAISLAPATSIERSFYGWAVALGDLDHDGKTDVIAGAFGDDDVRGLNRVGRVFIFPSQGGGLFGAPRVLENPFVEEHAQFGFTLAAGDVDGDGRQELVVSSYRSSIAALIAGIVLVFAFDDQGAPTNTHVLTRPFANYADGFGVAITIADITGDGRGEIIIGAEAADVGGVNEAGDVSIFSLP